MRRENIAQVICIRNKLDEYSMGSKITKSMFDMPINPHVKISFQQYIRCNCTSVRDAW